MVVVVAVPKKGLLGSSIWKRGPCPRARRQPWIQASPHVLLFLLGGRRRRRSSSNGLVLRGRRRPWVGLVRGLIIFLHEGSARAADPEQQIRTFLTPRFAAVVPCQVPEGMARRLRGSYPRERRRPWSSRDHHQEASRPRDRTRLTTGSFQPPRGRVPQPQVTSTMIAMAPPWRRMGCRGGRGVPNLWAGSTRRARVGLRGERSCRTWNLSTVKSAMRVRVAEARPLPPP